MRPSAWRPPAPGGSTQLIEITLGSESFNVRVTTSCCAADTSVPLWGLVDSLGGHLSCQGLIMQILSWPRLPVPPHLSVLCNIKYIQNKPPLVQFHSISIFKGALCDPAKWFLFYFKWLASLIEQIDACLRIHWGKVINAQKYTRGTANQGQPITDKMVGGHSACYFNDPISWLQLRPPTGEEGKLHLYNLKLHLNVCNCHKLQL